MYDCARIVEKFSIDGDRFLNLSEYERNRFCIMDQPQLQKIVHDIKKNDSGIMNKFKKFPTEHVALIYKTGKNTWDRLTNKPPPSVPPVDYVAEHPVEEDQWTDEFDSDYENPDDHSDSEVYVVPTEENCDDSYEPPPSEHEEKKIPPPVFPCLGGDYADNKRPSQQNSWPSAKPPPPLPSQSSSTPTRIATLQPLSAALKPKLPPKPTDEEADYVVPVDDDDEEDNYIKPTEENIPVPLKPPAVNRSIKPTSKLDPSSSSVLPPVPEPPSSLDVYEIPEEEQEKPSPPLNRTSKPPLPKPVQRLSGGHFQERSAGKESFKPDRNILPLPRPRPLPKIEPDSLRMQDDESHHSTCIPDSKFPSVTVPSPLPRITKKLPNPALPPKPSFPDRDHLSVTEDKPIPAERRRGSTHDIPLPPIPSGVQKPLPQKPSILPRSPEPANRTLGKPRNSNQGGFATSEQDANVQGKPWYMASSDRKTAEDALYKSNKDGSFLVRRSSGQDLKQPYTLVVLYNKRVYNIPIRFIESTRQYALGREKSGEERFDSVAEIIENHQQTSLVLIDSQNNTKDSTKLKYITRVS
ncbi:B-cell linker protein isoform X3 [Varanus komodoensis]|uniref:B cell linker n=3 Tax=Varanus komodoensis TaxID=61221 RepID=A0A8D2IY89_VARKO|nr:B-cell linker protein isoform X3 [Varanus komodoensis]